MLDSLWASFHSTSKLLMPLYSLFNLDTYCMYFIYLFYRVDIEVIKRTGSSKERRLALKVEKVIRKPHQLLVTLLLCNAGCMEALPIFLDRLLNPVAAILISVTAILIFGEVLPQAICKRFGLQVGAHLAWFVQILMFISLPISWPFGKLLDWTLGEEKALFRRPQLREFVTLHAEGDGDGEEGMLTNDEVQVIHGALDMAHKTADAAMTPLNKVFSISSDAPLDRDLLHRIINAGHSRVPVYEGSDVRNIIGLILVKELLEFDFSSGNLLVRDCHIRDVDCLWANTPLYAVMELFRVKRRHMAVVMNPPRGKGSPDGASSAVVVGRDTVLGRAATLDGSPSDVVGIITVEDVIEELLMTEINDETDIYSDNTFLERLAPTPVDTALPADLQPYLARRRRKTLMALARQRSGGGNAIATAAAVAATRQARRETTGRSPPDLVGRVPVIDEDASLLDV